MVFEVAVSCGSEVGGVMIGVLWYEGYTKMPQVMGSILAVSVEDGCSDVKGAVGYSRCLFGGGR